MSRPLSRYFLGLSVLSILLMLATLGIGLFGGDYNDLFSTIEREAQPLSRKLAELRGELPQRPEEIAKVNAELEALFSRFRPSRDWTMIHVLLGVTTGLVVLLVNCLSVTYFIGTSRWTREVVETYGFSNQFLVRSDALKHKALPYSVASMLIIIVLAGLGAAAYRGASLITNASSFVLPHHLMAWLTTAGLAWSYYVQAGAIAENSALIEEVVDEVHRVRKERGLETEDDEEAEEIEAA